MKTLLSVAVCFASVLGVSLAARADTKSSNSGRPPRIFLPGEKKPLQTPIKIGAPSEVGFLRDAIYYARNAKATGYAVPREAAVFATVSIVSLEPGTVLGNAIVDRTRVWYAHGELKPSTFPLTNYLEGELRLHGNFGQSESPFSVGANTTLNVKIEQNGRTSLLYQVDGRNRLGKGPDVFQPDTNQEMLLTSTRDFGGQKSLITISLTKSWIEKKALADQKKPIGAQYRVTPTFVVSNADDGFLDYNVEMQGSILFTHYKDQKQKTSIAAVAFSGKTETGKGWRFEGTIKPFIVETRFDIPRTHRLIVTGEIEDHDDASANDRMWVYGYSAIDLQKTVEKGGIHILQGDNDSESGDLEIHIEKIADVF